MLAAKKKKIVDTFTNTCAWISCGYIARVLLNAISMYQVSKNWNSHGAIWDQLCARWLQCFPAWTVLQKDL